MGDKENFKHYFEIWWTGIKKIPETTSIHGFRFIADNNKHWTERIFWLVFVVLSWYGSSLLIAAQYDAFQNNPISFVVETTYKDWDTHFPSVAICENDNTKRIEEISDRLWGEDHDFNMEEVLKELAYFKGITYYTSQFCGVEDPPPNCIRTNFSYYANMVRSSCEDTLTNCSWNGISFRCCDYFRPLDTELGTCYAINTIQGREETNICQARCDYFRPLDTELGTFYAINTIQGRNKHMPSALRLLSTFGHGAREKYPPKLAMVSNQTTGPGTIKFDVLVTGNVYVFNEEEVPSLTTLGSDVLAVGPEMSHRRLIAIRNIENDAGARIINPVKRKCRYSDENSLEVYRHYSYSACTVQCRKDAQMRKCNCTNFFMPNIPEHLKCGIKGIICLNSYLNELSVLKAKWSSRPGLYCDCLPSCTEAEITVVKDSKITTSEEFATIQIGLSALPSERYRRNVVRGVLDLVVSTGGTGGLFLGASILSFVELVYIVLVRPFCDVYSQRGEDPWYRKFGTRRLEDNKFTPKPDWSYDTTSNRYPVKKIKGNFISK